MNLKMLKYQPQQIQGTYDDFDFDPTHAYAVAQLVYNPATQAVMAGVPVFVGSRQFSI